MLKRIEVLCTYLFKNYGEKRPDGTTPKALEAISPKLFYPKPNTPKAGCPLNHSPILWGKKSTKENSPRHYAQISPNVKKITNRFYGVSAML